VSNGFVVSLKNQSVAQKVYYKSHPAFKTRERIKSKTLPEQITSPAMPMIARDSTRPKSPKTNLPEQHEPKKQYLERCIFAALLTVT